MTDQQMLSVSKAAQLLGVHRKTLLSYIQTGKLEATRLPGGHYRVDRAALEALAAPSRGDQ